MIWNSAVLGDGGLKRKGFRAFLVAATALIVIIAFTPRLFGCLDANFFFDPYPTPAVGETVTFDGSTSQCNWNSTTQEEISIDSYEWSFGDGSVDVGEVVTHIFAEQGTYDVALTIIDVKGNSSTLSIEIEVGSASNGGSGEFPWWIAIVFLVAGVGVILPVYYIKTRKPTK